MSTQESPAPSHEALLTSPSDGALLALGVEMSGVRACLLEPVAGEYRLAGWLALPRKDEQDAAFQLAESCRRLGRRLGRTLWDDADEAPLIFSADLVRRPPLSHVTVAASSRPHVRVWLAGLTASQSTVAAREALRGAPAHIIGLTIHMANLNVATLADQLALAKPDLLVVTGGFDTPEQEMQPALLDLCRLFGQALARLAPTQRPGVIYAGNRWPAAKAAELLQISGSSSNVEVVENVLPLPGALQGAPLAQAVNFFYWRLSRRTPGFKEMSRWVTSPGHIVSLESSFAQLTQLWLELNGLPVLHGLYCAGAWWLHVCARTGQNGLQLRFVEPRTRSREMADWPPVQLICGEGPGDLWPLAERHWWDRTGMTPVVAAIGQVAPQAMIQVLRADLLRGAQE